METNLTPTQYRILTDLQFFDDAIFKTHHAKPMREIRARFLRDTLLQYIGKKYQLVLPDSNDIFEYIYQIARFGEPRYNSAENTYSAIKHCIMWCEEACTFDKTYRSAFFEEKLHNLQETFPLVKYTLYHMVDPQDVL